MSGKYNIVADQGATFNLNFTVKTDDTPWDLSGYNVKKVEIFNRYGTKVYSKSNYVDEWHGQSDDSNELPDGTYYYVVEFNDSPVKTGWVYINREQ